MMKLVRMMAISVSVGIQENCKTNHGKRYKTRLWKDSDLLETQETHKTRNKESQGMKENQENEDESQGLKMRLQQEEEKK